MDSINNFYNLLFDESDHVCYTHDVQGTVVYKRNNNIRLSTNYFCINALDGNIDHNPTKEYHRANRARRARVNVIKHRNILLEMDMLTTTEQKELINRFGFPWSTAVYSGGKSIHFILSLDEPLLPPEYDALVKRIHRLFGGNLDKACKDPSRLSRCPGVYREDKKQEQLLLKIKGRVPFKVVDDLLNKYGIDEPFELTPSIYDLLDKRPNIKFELKNLEKALKNIIESTEKGTKHDGRRRAAYLAGGYVGAGLIDEHDAVNLVMQIVTAHGTDDLSKSLDTVKECISNGKNSPIQK